MIVIEPVERDDMKNGSSLHPLTNGRSIILSFFINFYPKMNSDQAVAPTSVETSFEKFIKCAPESCAGNGHDAVSHCGKTWISTKNKQTNKTNKHFF